MPIEQEMGTAHQACETARSDASTAYGRPPGKPSKPPGCRSRRCRRRTSRSCGRPTKPSNGGDLPAASPNFTTRRLSGQTSAEDSRCGTTHQGAVFAVRRYIESYMETFPGLRADLEDCVEAPGGQGSGHRLDHTGRGKGERYRHGDWRQVLVYTLRAGLIVRAEEYFGPRRSSRSRRAVGVAALDEKH